jgi:hypothetical protein
MAKSKAKYKTLFLVEPHTAFEVDQVVHNGESTESCEPTSGEALIRISEVGTKNHIVLTGEEMANLATQWLRLMGKKIDGW